MPEKVNAFIGELKKPTENQLSAALGASKQFWVKLVADLADENGVDVQEWNSYSPKAGWALRLKRKKRTIVWLSPCHSYFRVMFILGDKAVKAARQSKLPQRIMKIIDEATRYPEGTGLRIDVKGAKDIPVIKKLAAIKLEN